MKANELRIGNLVYSKETNQIQKITGLTDENPFINAITFDYINYDEIEAIPITEEWLLKFGFDKSCMFYRLESEKFYFSYNSMHPKFEIQYNSRDGHILFPVDLTYLHQLQNLYFALTNEELEMNY